MNILIYNSGGGLGDSIQVFNLINSLNIKFKSDKIWYLGAHKNHFQSSLREYNLNINNFNLDLKYFGFRWKHWFQVKNRQKNSLNINFDLVIDLQSKLRNTLILKRLKSKIFYSPTLNFLLSSEQKNYVNTKNDINNILLNLEKILKIKIPLNPYNINKIDKKYHDEASRLLPNSNYIGFSVTQGNKYRKKTWPLNKFINIANRLNNLIPVFFIEKNNVKLIKEISSSVKTAIFPETDTLLSCPALITAMSARLKKAITNDNGIMHMMGLANIPMITLFGPTNSNKFAPKIKNIKILDSKKIYNSEDISKITEEEVLNLI
jgi:ADP-heptose:LPS heptosyltransferase